MSRKAQGLSLNAIIIAVIVLVVLVIILGITTGYFSVWRGKFGAISATSCADAKGKVVSKLTDCDSLRQKEGTGIYDDVEDDQKCCLPKRCGDSIAGYGIHCVSSTSCPDYQTEKTFTGCGGGQVCCQIVTA